MSAADKPKQPPLAEYGWLLVLSTMWGSSFAFLKLTVATVPPLTAIAWRTAIAGAALYALMRWKGWSLPRDWATWRSYLVVSVINTIFPFILIAWGLQSVDASLAVILNSTTPIFAFLITWALTRQEPVTARRLFGVVAGIVGIALIVGTTALSGLGQQLLPQLGLVLASVSYATTAIYGRAIGGVNPVVPACGSLLIGAVVLAPMALVVDRPWTVTPTLDSVLALVFLALACTAFGNVLYFRLLGTLGSLGTTAQAYLRVPMGVAAGMLLLGEQLTSTAGLGLVCVVAGVMTMTWPPDRPLPVPWHLIAQSRAWLADLARRLPPRTFDYALLLFVATLWGASYVWVKVGLGSIPPLTLMTGRIVIAAIVLLAVLRWREGTLPRDRETWSLYFKQGALSMVLPFALVAWGQQWVDAGPAAILNSIAPVFAFLITWGLTRHEPATPLKLFGVIAGLAGVIVVIGPGSLAGPGFFVNMDGPTLAYAAIVLSSLCYAMGAINSHHLRKADPVVSAAGSMLAASALILPFALVIERPWTVRPSSEALTAMLTLGLVSTGLGYILWFRLVRALGSIGVTSNAYLRAPIGVLLAALMLGETVTLGMLAGMALVVAGVAAMTIPTATDKAAIGKESR